jgi:hypothetical protein
MSLATKIPPPSFLLNHAFALARPKSGIIEANVLYRLLPEPTGQYEEL